MSIPDGPEPICKTDKQTFQNLARRAVEHRKNASCRSFFDAQTFRFDVGDLTYCVGCGKLRRPKLDRDCRS
jgi:hypothetical protein